MSYYEIRALERVIRSHQRRRRREEWNRIEKNMEIAAEETEEKGTKIEAEKERLKHSCSAKKLKLQVREKTLKYSLLKTK